MIRPRKNLIKKCVLNCKNDKKLFSFPDHSEASKLWLKMLGLSETPLCRSEMYVCINHFSSQQLSDNGRTITPTSIPDKNIPGRVNPPESKIKMVQSAPRLQSNLKDIPQQNKQLTMITSDSSRCYLKCKNYKHLHRFPSDLTSFNVWIGKLGLPQYVKLNRTASLCDNHFSPAMRTSKAITRTAVPDIYLPSQCTFRDEFGNSTEKSISQTSKNERITSSASSQSIVIGPVIINEPTTAEIVTNPITNITKVVDQTAQKEGNPLDTQPSLDTSDVICPENYKTASFECVLKCPDSKTLYRFPNVESRRQKWLTQIGLTHCFCNTRICSRHFSEKMLSKQRLTNTAYPDINLPEHIPPSRIRVASLPLQDEVLPEVQQVPQYTCALSVVTHNTENTKIINNTKYIKCTIDKKIPKRERSVQVEVGDLVTKANVSILADEDFDDGPLDIVENINFEQQPDYLVSKMCKPQVFPSKSKDMFECLQCGEISLDQESSQRHLNRHSDLSRLCFHCGRMFINEIRLRKHEMKVHSMEWKPLVRCPKEHCKKAFHSRKKLNQHLDEHVKPTKHFCCNCGRLFLSSLKLTCHLLACRPRKSKHRIK